MRWNSLYRLRSYLRSSAWVVPTLGIPAAILFAPLILRIDAATQWRGLGYSAEAARSILNAITPATSKRPSVIAEVFMPILTSSSRSTIAYSVS